MARVKEIEASYGCSAEINGVWHKFVFGIKLEVEEGDDTSKVKEMAWNTCEQEIEKKFDELLGSKQ